MQLTRSTKAMLRKHPAPWHAEFYPMHAVIKDANGNAIRVGTGTFAQAIVELMNDHNSRTSSE